MRTLSIIILSWLTLSNGLTFIIYGLDKWFAQSQTWRISEKTLWLLALCGGSIGALCGMHLFRHKTKKTSFQFYLALIIVGQAIIVAGIYQYISF